jgi:hypothetical protein
MVPPVAARKTHQRLLKFSFVTPKRLLQQYRPTTDIRDTGNEKSPEGSRGFEFSSRGLGSADFLLDYSGLAGPICGDRTGFAMP